MKTYSVREAGLFVCLVGWLVALSTELPRAPVLEKLAVIGVVVAVVMMRMVMRMMIIAMIMVVIVVTNNE